MTEIAALQAAGGQQSTSAAAVAMIGLYDGCGLAAFQILSNPDRD